MRKCFKDELLFISKDGEGGGTFGDVVAVGGRGGLDKLLDVLLDELIECKFLLLI